MPNTEGDCMTPDEVRQQFEAWCKQTYCGLSLEREPDNHAQYYDIGTDLAWAAWQAQASALEHQARRIGAQDAKEAEQAARIAELKTALRKYGRHATNCGRCGGAALPCSCGLYAALGTKGAT